MTTDEKRSKLDRFCDSHTCEDDRCPLHTKDFKCGRGFYFICKPGEFGYLSDDIIEKAYAIAFPDEKQKILQIKTIRMRFDFSEEFDYKVNKALKDGWILKDKFILNPASEDKHIMLIAEMEKEEEI